MIRRWMWPCDPTVTDMHRQTHNTHTHSQHMSMCAHNTQHTHTHTRTHTHSDSRVRYALVSLVSLGLAMASGRVRDGRRDAGLQKREAVLHQGPLVAQTSEALRSREAAEARVLKASKAQATSRHNPAQTAQTQADPGPRDASLYPPKGKDWLR